MRAFFTKKRIIYSVVALVLVLLIGTVVVKARSGADNIITEQVKQQSELQQTVLATGEVTSSTDVGLSFKNAGQVAKVNVKVGQQVKSGDILATLTQRDQSATLTQARGALAQAQANYRKIIAGADTPEVNVAKAAVKSAETTLANAQASYFAAEKQQTTLVNNARTALYNNDLQVSSRNVDSEAAVMTITGAYTGTVEGKYEFEVYPGTGGFLLEYRGIESGKGQKIIRGLPIPLGTKGLYLTVSTTGGMPSNRVWDVEVPNTKSATYVTYLNAYNSAVQTKNDALTAAQNVINTAQSALDQANTNLDQTLAAARPEDVAVAQAQILSAQGQVEAANAAFEATIIRAPAEGTITAIEVKVGEQASITEPAIVLKDVNNLYVEAFVSEANISALKQDQPVELTFDALDPDQKFNGRVVLIDPASTLVSGIVNYKVTASVDKLDVIKPGMTANLKVIVQSKKNVLTIPERAVINQGGQKVVRVITDTKKKSYVERLVTTGVKGDGGLIEVTSGLEVGQEIVTDIKE